MLYWQDVPSVVKALARAELKRQLPDWFQHEIDPRDGAGARGATRISSSGTGAASRNGTGPDDVWTPSCASSKPSTREPPAALRPRRRRDGASRRRRCSQAMGGRSRSGGGAGPTATFFDYVATTLAIFCVTHARRRHVVALRGADEGHPSRSNWNLLSYFVTLRRRRPDRVVDHPQRFRAAAAQGGGRVRRKSRAGEARAGQPAERTSATRGSAGTRSRSSSCSSGVRPSCCSRAVTRRRARPWRFGRRGEAVRSRSTSRSTISATTPTCAGRSSPHTRAWSARSRASGLGRHLAEAPFEYIEPCAREPGNERGTRRRPHDPLRVGEVAAVSRSRT